jgi:hypothetical protein
MTSSLTLLWNRIDGALESQVPEVIVDVFNQAMMLGEKEKNNKHEFYYAAGYVAYMHPEGKKNMFLRKQAVEALLLSLLNCPGFLPSVLYLAFIKMDEMRYLDALELLCSCGKKTNSINEQLIDRYVEAIICCLVECGFWREALSELKWFDVRMKEDYQVGIDLINFMKIIEKFDPENDIQKAVIKKIKVVLGV